LADGRNPLQPFRLPVTPEVAGSSPVAPAKYPTAQHYGTNTTQVRAAFMDASGKTLSAIRIGPDTTIGGENMALRSRNGTVPSGAASVEVIITFTEHNADYNYAGADDVSLVLS
jgi:hypothetical protein